jgi:hypothetical protein
MAMDDGLDSGQHNQLSPIGRTHYESISSINEETRV